MSNMQKNGVLNHSLHSKIGMLFFLPRCLSSHNLPIYPCLGLALKLHWFVPLSFSLCILVANTTINKTNCEMPVISICKLYLHNLLNLTTFTDFKSAV